MTFWRSWMTDLTGRGPIGLKTGKPAKRPRKPIPRMSARKWAHKAKERALGASEHMEWVKGLPCICCGAVAPSEAHHVTGDKMPRSDFRVIPLCYACHRGAEGYHNAKRAWVKRHGPDYMLLDAVASML